MAQDAETLKRTLTYRCCRYCRAKFIPRDPRGKDAKFCSENHRKMFWRYGGLPFDKMKNQIMKAVKQLVQQEMQRYFAARALTGADASETANALKRAVREELSRLLASLGQSTP